MTEHASKWESCIMHGEVHRTDVEIAHRCGTSEWRKVVLLEEERSKTSGRELLRGRVGRGQRSV